MSPITLVDYWMGRDTRYPDDMKPFIATNARELLARVNEFLRDFAIAVPQALDRTVNSGWRPPSVNAGTKGASRTSAHLTGEAIDLSDDDEVLDAWINSPAGLDALVRHDLYAEHRDYTPRWAHLQTRKVSSGRRVFVPY